MQSSKIVTKQFVADFELVAEHFGLKECGEYEHAKQAARNDLENAMTSYAAMAAGIEQ